MEPLSDSPATSATDSLRADVFSTRTRDNPGASRARSDYIRALRGQAQSFDLAEAVAPSLMHLWLAADLADLRESTQEQAQQLKESIAANYFAFPEYAKELGEANFALSQEIKPLVELTQVADFITKNMHRSSESLAASAKYAEPALKALLSSEARMREMREPLATRLSWVDPVRLMQFDAVVAGALGRTDADTRRLDANAAHAQRLRERPMDDPFHPLRLEREAREVAAFIAANHNLHPWKIASNLEQADQGLLDTLNDASRMAKLDPLVHERLSGISASHIATVQAVIANTLDRIDAPERTRAVNADRAAIGLEELALNPRRDTEAVVDFVAANRNLAPHRVFQNLAEADKELKTIFSDRGHVESIEKHISQQLPAKDALAIAEIHEVIAVALDRGDASELIRTVETLRLATDRQREHAAPLAPSSPSSTFMPEAPVANDEVQPRQGDQEGDQNHADKHFSLRTRTAPGKELDTAHSSLHTALRAFQMTPYAERPRVVVNGQVVAEYESGSGTIPRFRDEHIEAAYLNAYASPGQQLAIREAQTISNFLLPNISRTDEELIDACGKAAPDVRALLGDTTRMKELAGLLSKQSGVDPVDLRRVQALLARQPGEAPSPAQARPSTPSPSGAIHADEPPATPIPAPMEAQAEAAPRPAGNGFSPAGPPRPSQERPAPASVAGILDRITYKTRGDGSVEYSFDGRTAFVDHGDQILMVGKADHDEQAIVAAVLVAKEKYGGAFELTGDIEFKRRTIEILVRYNIDVMLKSPEQDAMRRDIAKSAQTASPRPASASNPATPVDLKSLVHSIDAARRPPDACPPPPSPPAGAPEQSAPPAEPVNRLAGTVLRHGAAPYEHNPRQKMSYFVELENADGQTRTTWGVDLERVAREQLLKAGDTVVLQNLGRTPVEVKQSIFDKDGKVIGSETVVSHRNAWEIEFVKRAAPAEKDATVDERDKADATSPAPNHATSFIDAGAWWTSQRDIIHNLSDNYADMQASLERLGPRPPDGQVYWFDGGRSSPAPPDAADILGQRSVLEARPAADARPVSVLHAIATRPDGTFAPSLLLFKSSTGDHMQGIVQIGEQKQQVIAHIVNGGAGEGGQAIRLSAMTMTPDGPSWNVIGHGKAINSGADGKQVYFDEVRFTVGDTTLVARVSDRLGHAERQKIGFDKPRRERPKDESVGAPDTASSSPSNATSSTEARIGPPAGKPARNRNAPARA